MSHQFTRPCRTSQRFGRPRITLAVVAAFAMFAGESVSFAQTTWTAGSTVTLNATYTVTDVLTIEPGVTVRSNSSVALVVGPTGRLVVEGTETDPVRFTSIGGFWQGLRFEPGSEGQISGAIIEKCFRYGVEILSASPVIQSSTIRTVGYPQWINSADVAGVRVRKIPGESDANPIILHCLIEGVAGFRGESGSTGQSGTTGSSGAAGTILSPNGAEGGPGGLGAPGLAGATGQPAYGVFISDDAGAIVGYSTIRNIRGGQGGTGGTGGTGGSGGRGGNGWTGIASGGNGGRGGIAGEGGSGGTGGWGGRAVALHVASTSEQVYFFQNLVHRIEAGQGGTGGMKGRGGRGGDGGDGGDCSGLFCNAGNGGAGRTGGNAGQFGGQGSFAGSALFVDAVQGGPVSLISNTFGDIRRGVAGSPGPGGFGGFGGTGGARGVALTTGTNGANGANSASGANSSPGAPGYQGSTRGVRAELGSTITLHNNIVAMSGVGQMLASLSGSFITADYNNFSGYSVFSSGSSAIGTHNTHADPLFINPSAGDFRFANSTSPAINAGSNALLPLDIFDLDNDDDTGEPIPYDLAGNPRIQNGIVDVGAFEGVASLQVYSRSANAWMNSGLFEAYAFDEFLPGVPNGGGCLASNDAEPVVIPLEGGTVTVSSFMGQDPVCAVIDGAGVPAVSDAALNNADGNGMLVFEFDPPVTGFYSYFGSLAVGATATMRLYADDGGPALSLVETITTAPSTHQSLATGLGFRAPIAIRRIEFTTTEIGTILVGAFVGLLGAEHSLGTVEIADYAGPAGPSVQLDFACSFRIVETPCPADINGDGVINFADLNTVLGAFGDSGDALPADVNGDGVVNFADLNAVLTAFGNECPA